MKKSYKRELGIVALIAWIVLTIFHFTVSDPTLVQAQSGSYSVASFSLWAFIGSMFGIHSIATQFNKPPKDPAPPRP